MKKVEIYTDGACSGNPGPGGWGAVLKYGEHTLEISGGSPNTTNNKMELTGVIEALKRLKEPCDVVLTTDSKYIVDSVNKKWVYNWRAKNWLKADKKPAMNVDLWEELLKLLDKHNVEFVWIKGHNGHKYNEKCDKLAVVERDKYSSSV
jgi:ribonuclease HI